MTPDDFKTWRKSMGFTQAQAAEALDMSRENIINYEAGQRRDNSKPVVIPRTVALACAALSAGLGPWVAES